MDHPQSYLQQHRTLIQAWNRHIEDEWQARQRIEHAFLKEKQEAENQHQAALQTAETQRQTALQAAETQYQTALQDAKNQQSKAEQSAHDSLRHFTSIQRDAEKEMDERNITRIQQDAEKEMDERKIEREYSTTKPTQLPLEDQTRFESLLQALQSGPYQRFQDNCRDLDCAHERRVYSPYRGLIGSFFLNHLLCFGSTLLLVYIFYHYGGPGKSYFVVSIALLWYSLVLSFELFSQLNKDDKYTIDITYQSFLYILGVLVALFVLFRPELSLLNVVVLIPIVYLISSIIVAIIFALIQWIIGIEFSMTIKGDDRNSYFSGASTFFISPGL
ncbi:MAG: hypothetical protein HC837_18850 [Chloroflexaceae bacterium]|nr:hypothetical protein [Chloroflexaceae bacterium]